MEELIAKCADDMLEAANSGTLSRDAQVRAYDLMENARRAHQKAQQACFSANISYKIQPGLHARIASILTEE